MGLSNLSIDVKFDGLGSAVSQFPTFKASFQVQDAEKIAASIVRISGNTVGRLGNLWIYWRQIQKFSKYVLWLLSPPASCICWSQTLPSNSPEVEGIVTLSFISFSGNKRKKKRSMSLSVDSREEIYWSSTPYDEYSSSSCILFSFFQGEGSLIAGVYDNYLLSESFPAFRLALHLSHTERDKFLVSMEG